MYLECPGYINMRAEEDAKKIGCMSSLNLYMQRLARICIYIYAHGEKERARGERESASARSGLMTGTAAGAYILSFSLLASSLPFFPPGTNVLSYIRERASSGYSLRIECARAAEPIVRISERERGRARENRPV